MPNIDGYEFIKTIRLQNKTIPAVIISSYSDKEKLFGAIKLNLVDYLVRPFELSKLKTILQECADWICEYNTKEIELSSDICYNLATKTLYCSDKTIPLTKFEAYLLEYLLSHETKIVTFEELIDNLPFSNTTRKSIVNTIYKLNKKLSIPIISNMKDVGYILKRELKQ